ncbi:NAD(P)/FAD-dependent oxidoreductase [Tengunoibacter tsumagoiensis]|uniref:FAD-dependent oxidoreductase n=1 Tax=Tengunoibacter tsumagoiensis TaxID=2014871 RepID=A0A402A2V4_9CHLR|nr:FAD-dependent oxidoreductase [Tengunoibacter tsumagoiensis]GCE13341.1 FAD-dependent oxidoreductase [Tengunoibacter tsumagoiensis]
MSIAIIGAGMSGLAAAHTLRDAGLSVHLFEKSRGPGGRATTRQRDGFIYDGGAQYFKEGNPAITSLITDRFATPDLLNIGKPVWIFNEQGEIQPGDPTLTEEHKWSYRNGLSSLANRMAEGLPITTHTRIDTIEQHADGWTLADNHGQLYGPFEKILLAIPAEQSSTIIANSQLDQTLQAHCLKHLKMAHYNRQLSIALGYQSRPQERPYYAIVNTDKKHAISWLAWEHEKAPERVPAGAGLLLAQMSPSYSLTHWDDEDPDLIQDAARQVEKLLQEELGEPIVSDVQRWLYALPSARADAETLNALSLPEGLAFCGDSFVGGRLHLALEHGITIASKLT